LNKQVGGELGTGQIIRNRRHSLNLPANWLPAHAILPKAHGISEITVKAHRGSLMRKMKADSLADLVKMAAKLGLSRFGSTNALPV
jgi:hypothetical protein